MKNNVEEIVPPLFLNTLFNIMYIIFQKGFCKNKHFLDLMRYFGLYVKKC